MLRCFPPLFLLSCTRLSISCISFQIIRSIFAKRLWRTCEVWLSIDVGMKTVTFLRNLNLDSPLGFYLKIPVGKGLRKCRVWLLLWMAITTEMQAWWGNKKGSFLDSCLTLPSLFHERIRYKIKAAETMRLREAANFIMESFSNKLGFWSNEATRQKCWSADLTMQR